MDLPRKNSSASAHLDFIRGLAAVFVAFGHARQIVVEDPKNVGPISFAGKLFYFFATLANPSVIVFFVLSGYLVGTSVVQSVEGARWSWRKYAIARLSRIYVVLVPALVLGYAIDSLGLRLFASSPIYSSLNHGAVLPPDAKACLSPSIALGNLLNLQDILVPTLGTNHPLWSLNYEVWYYALFPATVILFARRSTRGGRVFGGLLSVAVALLIFDKLYLYPIWFAGASIAWMPRRPVKPYVTAIVAGLLIVALALQSLKLFGNVFLTGIFATALTYCIVAQPSAAVSVRYRALSASLSNVSYSLYLTHVPLLAFMAACVLPNGRRLLPATASIGLTLALLAACGLYAFVVWWCFERQTQRVKDWIESRSAPRRVAQASSVERAFPCGHERSLSKDGEPPRNSLPSSSQGGGGEARVLSDAFRASDKTPF